MSAPTACLARSSGRRVVYGGGKPIETAVGVTKCDAINAAASGIADGVEDACWTGRR